MSSLWYTCFLHEEIWMKNSINITLYKWVCGHRKLKDSTKCCMSPDDDFKINTTVTRWHPPDGIYNKFLCMHRPCLQDKDPVWPTTCHTSHKRNKSQQSTHTINTGSWTLFLCTHTIICEYVQLDWSHNTTPSIRDTNPFICSQATQGRQTIAHAP